MLQQPFSQGNLKSVLQESWGLLVFVSSGKWFSWEKLKSFCAQIVSGERDHKFEQGSDYWQLIHFQQIWNMSNNSSISRICRFGLTMKKECQANLTMGLSQASHGKKVMSHYSSLILSLTKLQCLALKSKPTPSKLNHWSSVENGDNWVKFQDVQNSFWTSWNEETKVLVGLVWSIDRKGNDFKSVEGKRMNIIQSS